MSLDVTGIEEHTGAAISNSLRVFPNPVAGRATLSYSLPHNAPVSCIVYDVAGNTVLRMSAGTQPAGEHRQTWDATGMEPGVYFCKLQAGSSTSTVRLTLVR
jgi:hypothetical protein